MEPLMKPDKMHGDLKATVQTGDKYASQEGGKSTDGGEPIIENKLLEISKLDEYSFSEEKRIIEEKE